MANTASNSSQSARFELLTTFHKHPAEIVCNSFLSALVLSVILGLTPMAASVAMIVAGSAELFYHWNIRTPRWLGYVIQRPESHRVHHQFGYHRNNYSDLPLWDILFGTFENPRASKIVCGFANERELMIWSMLIGRSVNSTIQYRF